MAADCLGDGAEVERGLLGRAAPPRELVVEEVAEEIGIVLLRGAELGGALVAESGPVGMAHVRECGARAALEVRKLVVRAEAAELLPHFELHGVRETAVLELGGASGAEGVEAPVAEACERFVGPCGLVAAEALRVLVAVGHGLQGFAPVAVPVGVIYAAEERRRAVGRDGPPAAAGILRDAPEAGGGGRRPRHKTRIAGRRPRRKTGIAGGRPRRKTGGAKGEKECRKDGIHGSFTARSS